MNDREWQGSEWERWWDQASRGGVEVPNRGGQGMKVGLGTARMSSSSWEVDDDARGYLVKA